ncbi:hypothetical protein GA707_19465 [Nostocoides sp. F2B08]|uniref:hypothetical protein n=1 Tax=Nostocoides sp. F2B08 TaxID=2653936 RepID=UPI001262FACF|nr:hypothetical protein [Tetrasphaera sp. F2B08]KAB7740337.1 hypothetical protein GA707_19465 [Tetrasphaera sp. F2B08]
MNVRTAAVLALAAALLTGCSNPEPTPGPTSAATPSPTGTPTTTTPTSASPEEEATAAAEEVVREYFETVPRCLADPMNTEPSCFDDVAIGTELNDNRNSLIAAQQVESTASGTLEVVSIEPQSVDLTHDQQASPPDAATVIFEVCTDVSEFQIVDKDGNSLVPEDRDPRVRTNMGVLNYDYPATDGWRVGFVEELEESTC